MSTANSPEPAIQATLQDVVDRLLANPGPSETRKRDLRSALSVFAKVVGQPLSAIPLELAAIRNKLDGVAPAQAKVTPKRWANLRSDLSAAIAASGLIEMLKTSAVEPARGWVALLRGKPSAIAHGLSRFARWATLRHIEPIAVNDEVMERFFGELDTNSLVRNLRAQRRTVAINWNKLAAGVDDLQRVQVPSHRPPSRRVSWDHLPASFRKEVEEYLVWCRVPVPLDMEARSRALAPETVRLRRDHIHLAVSAAVAAGLEARRLTSLARLVEPETYRRLLRQRWEDAGGQFSNYTRDVATTLMVIAGEWVEVSAKRMAQLKELRSKLGGSAQRGFTEKNRALLRRFEDPRLLNQLVQLPDKLWRAARRSPRKRSFIDLQNALAIDILLHVSPRIENLAALRFDKHIHWPQGRGKPAIIVLDGEETKNQDPLEFELPAFLAERLYSFRHDIAPPILGRIPDALFISRDGVPRALGTLRVAIQKAVLKHVGIKMSPHQFRHLAGKIALDDNPGAYEHVSQLLGHRDRKTTVRFYAGINTRRAGRAHAALIARVREHALPKRSPRPRRSNRKA
jgi:integrase